MAKDQKVCRHGKKLAWWREPCADCAHEERAKLDYEYLDYAERTMRDTIREALRSVGTPQWNENYVGGQIAQAVKVYVDHSIKVATRKP